MEAAAPEPHDIDYAVFEETCEFLCLPSERLQISAYKTSSIISMLSQVYFNRQDAQLIHCEVEYFHAWKFIRAILLFFSDLPTNEIATDFGIKSFVDTAFGEGQNTITLMEWIQFCDSNLYWADEPLRTFFRHIFLRDPQEPRLPLMSPNSDLINQEMLGMLYLSNQTLNQMHSNLTLIYSTSKHGNSLETLGQNIENYEGNILWLFQHVSTDSDLRMGKPTKVIFGAWTTVVPQTNGSETTDTQCYLFI